MKCFCSTREYDRQIFGRWYDAVSDYGKGAAEKFNFQDIYTVQLYSNGTDNDVPS